MEGDPTSGPREKGTEFANPEKHREGAIPQIPKDCDRLAWETARRYRFLSELFGTVGRLELSEKKRAGLFLKALRN